MNIEFRNNIWQKASWRRITGAAAFALLLAAGISGCKSADKAPIVNGADANGPDPADANLAAVNGSAPTGQPTYVAGTSQAYTPQQSSENYGAGQQAPAPIVRGNNAYLNESQNPNAVNNTQQGYADTGQAYDQGYNNGEAEGVEADQPPPQLAEYDQPPAPADNDLWTPGYWGYANTGYYWVPGAWVSAPYVGALWTPGYWGAYGNRYRWHRGYWGRHVGYYGGINYGWGYVGTGYYGGYWNSNRFYYNRAITHVSPRVVTVYERPVVVNNIRYTSYTNNRVSYNGGRGGINYQPRPFEVAAMREQHTGPLPEQQQFHQQAQMNRANFYAENHGRPAQAVLAQPVETRGFAGPAANPGINRGEANRGGFGRPGAQPGQNPAFQQNNNAGQAQRLQMEQQRNLQMQEQHNVQSGQQRNLQLQQQRSLQLQQAQQHNNAAEQQRNLQLQQHNQMEQQRNQVEQQRNQLPQHTVETQRNNALEQQRANENAQRNALTQHNQQLEQQRNQQVEQQRNSVMQQHNAEQQRTAEQAQRNAQIQQQQHVQQPQRNFQPQVQPRAEQPRVEQHVEQPHVQAQPQHVEQPHVQAQPQHVEQPHVQQAQPHIEQHSAPAAQPQGGHPGGGEGHPGGHH